MRSEVLVEVALMTTSAGPFTDDVFFVLTDADGRSETLPLGEDPDLLPRLRSCPDSTTRHSSRQ